MKIIFDLVEYLERQKRWSLETFGAGNRIPGLLNHAESEIQEIREVLGTQGSDDRLLEEATDLCILAFEIALRSGSVQSVLSSLERKAVINMYCRKWPDRDTLDPNSPAFHKKE